MAHYNNSMIYNEIMQNINEIIGTNKVGENVYNTFKISEKIIQDKEATFKFEPKMTGLLNSMGFTKEKTGNIYILFGQKYLDTYNKNSSLHHTILIHELKHLYDYTKNVDSFFNSSIKEKYWYEFAAKYIEAEFIKYYLVGKYKLSKFEEFILKSLENDDLDLYTIISQRISKHIYEVFDELETEYRNNKISIDNIMNGLVNDAFQLFEAYDKSNSDFSKYYKYIKIKSFRNCLEDIALVKNGEPNITFNDIRINYYIMEGIYSRLYGIIGDYKNSYSNYLLSLSGYLESNCLK
jgi:hypothetical protein